MDIYLRAFVLLTAKEFSELAKVLAFVPLGILTFLVPAPDTRLIVLELSWLETSRKKDPRPSVWISISTLKHGRVGCLCYSCP